MFFKQKLKIETVKSTIVWVKSGYKKALELEIFAKGELLSGNNFDDFLDYLLDIRFINDPDHKDRQAIREKAKLASLMLGKTLPAITIGILAAESDYYNLPQAKITEFQVLISQSFPDCDVADVRW